MRPIPVLLSLIVLGGLLDGCARREEPAGGASSTQVDVELLQPAPPEVAGELLKILESVDELRPGAAIAALEAFLEAHHGYQTDALVRREIEHHRSLTDPLYHEARELARQGRFDEAEGILLDLATYLPDTPVGRKAADHLDFDFAMNRVRSLMLQRRFAEAERAARALLDRDLSSQENEQVEQVLDNLGHVGAAMDMVSEQSTVAACRQVMVMLAQQYVETGYYPQSLSLAELEQWDPFNAPSLRRAISAIEGYRTEQDRVSFTVVSADGRHRIEVVDNVIQESP